MVVVVVLVVLLVVLLAVMLELVLVLVPGACAGAGADGAGGFVYIQHQKAQSSKAQAHGPPPASLRRRCRQWRLRNHLPDEVYRICA